MRRSATRRHAVDRSCPIGSRRAGPVNASVLTVKLASAIIGISSIHLLRTFTNAAA